MKDFFYKNLDASKLAKDYILLVYALLKKFPSYEQYALCDQLLRAVISIASNIAEGMGRMAIKERIHFLDIANGSLIEVLCQLDIAQSLGYINNEELQNAEDAGSRLSNVLSGLRKHLSGKITEEQ